MIWESLIRRSLRKGQKSMGMKTTTTTRRARNKRVSAAVLLHRLHYFYLLFGYTTLILCSRTYSIFRPYDFEGKVIERVFSRQSPPNIHLPSSLTTSSSPTSVTNNPSLLPALSRLYPSILRVIPGHRVRSSLVPLSSFDSPSLPTCPPSGARSVPPPLRIQENLGLISGTITRKSIGRRQRPKEWGGVGVLAVNPSRPRRTSSTIGPVPSALSITGCRMLKGEGSLWLPRWQSKHPFSLLLLLL